jgi:hypothetical protein
MQYFERNGYEAEIEYRLKMLANHSCDRNNMSFFLESCALNPCQCRNPEIFAWLIPDHLLRNQALRHIINSYKEDGKLAEAQRLFSEAERAAMLIPVRKGKSDALSVIAEIYRQEGMLAEAERVALLIPVHNDKSAALYEIAEIYKKEGKLAEAERVALLIPEPECKSWMLRDLAKAYLEANNFVDSVRLARLIPEPECKSWVLRDIILFCKPAGKLAEVVSLLSEMERTVMLISEPEGSRILQEEVSRLKPKLFEKFLAIFS